jgi:hypothetical protein
MHTIAAFVVCRRLIASTFAGVALLGCGAPATSSEPPSTDDASEIASFHDEGLLGNALTRSEVRTVLKLIDDVCGDTWCEGDDDFRFRNLFCESRSGTCSLMFQTAPRDGTSPPRWRWQTCRTTGFLGFESLVDTTSGGYPWIADGYYQALSACIDGVNLLTQN